jgi:hypothetical protein
MGKSGDLTYQAIIATGHLSVIEYNRIDSTGYIPIRFESDSALVRYNVISNFLFVKDDGGGIYTWNNGPNAPENLGRVVSNNMISNGIGQVPVPVPLAACMPTAFTSTTMQQTLKLPATRFSIVLKAAFTSAMPAG